MARSSAPEKPVKKAPLTDADENGELPVGWSTTLLGDYVYLAARIGWRGLKAEEYTDTGPLFLSVHSLNNGEHVDYRPAFHISRERFDESPEIVLKENDVLLTKDGAGIGKLAIVKNLPGPATINSSLLLIRTTEVFLPKFLYYILAGPKMQDIVKSRITGSATPHLFQRDIKQFEIAVPPRPEQKRIVAKVEALLARVNAARERLAKVPPLLKRFRQAVLADACSGRLTEDWRKLQKRIESASDALDAVAKKSGETKTRRGIPDSVPLPESLEEKEWPKGWAIVPVGELLKKSALLDVKDGNHGANHPKVSEFTEKGLPFITAAQVRDYRIDYVGAYKVSGKALERMRVGFAEPGDAILTHKGSVGRTALNSEKCVLTPQTTYYRCNEDVIHAKYLVYYFASPQFYNQLAAVMSQTTRDFVPISEQYSQFLILPPLAEQREIVRRVEKLFKLADAIEERVAAATRRADRLSQAILAKAFRGELVPTEAALARRENRPYEPASELLKRIQSERTASQEPTPKRKKG